MRKLLGGGLLFSFDVFEELLFAVDEGVYVVGGEFETMAVGDGVGGAGFDAIAAEDAAAVIDVVDLGVALSGGDAIVGGVFGSLDVDAVRGAGSGAEEAADALFEAVFIALENVNATIARLEIRGRVGVVFRDGLTESVSERNTETLDQRHSGFAELSQQGCHRRLV